jgi:hypothetical protein
LNSQANRKLFGEYCMLFGKKALSLQRFSDETATTCQEY